MQGSGWRVKRSCVRQKKNVSGVSTEVQILKITTSEVCGLGFDPPYKVSLGFSQSKQGCYMYFTRLAWLLP